MSTQLEEPRVMMFDRGGPEAAATEKPKTYEEMGLFLVLIVLLAWALFAGLRTVDWPAISHTIKVFLAAIW